MNLKYTYVIGTHVMFYEIEILSEYVESLIQTVKEVDNPENVTFDFLFNISEYLEAVDATKTTKTELLERYYVALKPLKDTGVKVQDRVYNDNENLYSIADYRRDFNYHNCVNYDYLMWGETDSLLPKQLFES